MITQIKYNFMWLWSFLFLLREKILDFANQLRERTLDRVVGLVRD